MKQLFFYGLIINLAGLSLAHAASIAPTDSIIRPTISDKTESPIYQQTPTPSVLADDKSNVQNDNAINVTEQDLLENPPLLQKALYSSVINNHVSAIRLLLPLYEKLPSEYQTGNDNELLLTLARASLAKQDGKYSTAVDLYQKALTLDPSIHAARFALAQSFYEDKQYRSAKREFTTLKDTPNLPQAVEQTVVQYLNAIDKKDDWQLYAGANYTQDKNITNSPDYRTVNFGYGTWTLPERESAQGLSYQFNASKDIHLDGHIHSKSEFDIYGKWYWDNHKYDDMTLRAATGLAYENARTELAVLPYFERRIYADNGYSKELGVRGELTTQINNKHRVQASVEYGDESYDDRVHLDGHRRQASLSWLWLQNSKQYWTLTGDFNHKDAHDLSDAYYRRGVRLGVVRSWGQTNTALSVGVARKHYEARDFLYIDRKDMEYQGSLSIWDNRIRFWGVTPRLVGSYQRVDSNHPFYDYEKKNVFIQLSKSF